MDPLIGQIAVPDAEGLSLPLLQCLTFLVFHLDFITLERYLHIVLIVYIHELCRFLGLDKSQLLVQIGTTPFYVEGDEEKLFTFVWLEGLLKDLEYVDTFQFLFWGQQVVADLVDVLVGPEVQFWACVLAQLDQFDRLHCPDGIGHDDILIGGYFVMFDLGPSKGLLEYSQTFEQVDNPEPNFLTHSMLIFKFLIPDMLDNSDIEYKLEYLGSNFIAFQVEDVSGVLGRVYGLVAV